MKQAKEISRTNTTMEKQQHKNHDDEEEHDTISLSDFHMDNDTKTGSEEVINTSTFDQDFFGININSNEKMEEETNPAFRSNSGSFRYMRFKVGSRSWRSSSLSVMASKSKSRWQVFMSGFGSGRFPAKMDMVDIKTRQLRTQSTAKVSGSDDRVCTEDRGGQRVKKKVWWRLVDVLGCGGGSERNNMVVA